MNSQRQVRLVSSDDNMDDPIVNKQSNAFRKDKNQRRSPISYMSSSSSSMKKMANGDYQKEEKQVCEIIHKSRVEKVTSITRKMAEPVGNNIPTITNCKVNQPTNNRVDKPKFSSFGKAGDNSNTITKPAAVFTTGTNFIVGSQQINPTRGSTGAINGFTSFPNYNQASFSTVSHNFAQPILPPTIPQLPVIYHPVLNNPPPLPIEPVINKQPLPPSEPSPKPVESPSIKAIEISLKQTDLNLSPEQKKKLHENFTDDCKTVAKVTQLLLNELELSMEGKLLTAMKKVMANLAIGHLQKADK